MKLKCALLLAGVAAGVSALYLTRAGGYARLAFDKGSRALAARVPLETELERVRAQVADLAGEADSHLSALAHEIEEEKAGERKLAAAKGRLDGLRADMQKLAAALESGGSTFRVGERAASAEEARAQLLADLDAHRRAEEGVKLREEELTAKRDTVATLRGRVTEFQQAHGELELELARLHKDLTQLKAAEARGKYKFDGSKLADARASLDEVGRRLGVRRTRLELDAHTEGRVRVEAGKPQRDPLKEYHEKFGTKAVAAEPMPAAE